MLKVKPYEPSDCEKDLLFYIDKNTLLKLEQAFGGTQIYIAATPRQDLVDAVGQRMANVITEIFKTEHIYVPQKLMKYRRNEQIFKEINNGVTMKELAAKYKIKTHAIKALLIKQYNYKASLADGK